MSKSLPSVLLAAAKWAPPSARMAGALHRHGCRVSAICPGGHPLRHVHGIDHVYPYHGISSLGSLRSALQECRPEIVIPCDEGVVAQLHALYDVDASLRAVVSRSLGSPDSYSIVDSRYQFLATAMKLGLQVPRMRRTTGPDDIVAWHAQSGSPAVLKVDGDSGGHGVRISSSVTSSLAAWQELRAPYGLPTALKRLAIDRNPLALWRRGHEREVMVQEYISGRPANSMLVCWRGELLALVSVAVVAADGATGAATIVRVIQNDSMKLAAQQIVSHLQLSGFFGLDFVIESATGIPYLIELNPRCTQLGHIEFPAEGCLAGILSAVLRGEERPAARNPIRSNTIALFPQALAAGAACRAHVEAGYHDVPADDPKLSGELMLKSWPQRQWLSRVYHAFNPPKRTQPTLYEDLDAEPVSPRAHKV